MDSESAAKISQILQLTVMKICQSVVDYTDQLAVQGVVSVEADGHDVCTVTFSDSNEKEAQRPRDSATTTSRMEQKRSLEYYRKDAEKDGYESDISDCDRMVIDENQDLKSNNSQCDAADSAAGSDTESSRPSEQSSAPSVDNTTKVKSAVEMIPTRKVSRRKASVPMKQGVSDRELESEDEGFESQKSRLSSQGDNTDDSSENKDDSLFAPSEQKPVKSDTVEKTQEPVVKSNTSKTSKKELKLGESVKLKNASKFKLKICESGGSNGEKLSPSTDELISRPPEVPESPSQRLSGNERSLVNTLVAKALKLWYDDDAPGGGGMGGHGMVSDSPRRGYLSVSPRGKGAFELLHSPTSPLNLTKHSKETVSKALLFTADSEFNTPDAKHPYPAAPTSTSTPSAMTTARLRALIKERAEIVTGIPANSVAMPIDEKESATLMQFASQLPGWIPLESLTSPEITKFANLNKQFAQMNRQQAEAATTGGHQQPRSQEQRSEQHAFSRKSYSCQLCQKTFVHSTNLTRHMRTAHGQQARYQRRAQSQDDVPMRAVDSSATPRTPEIISSAMRDNRELMEKAAAEAETPRRHSASDAEAAQILSSMRELVTVRGMESHILAQQRNEQAVTPKGCSEPEVLKNSAPSDSKYTAPLSAHVPVPLATDPAVATADQPAQSGTGHPDALPLSNSPRKENHSPEAPGNGDVVKEGMERNPLTPSDFSHNRLFKCVECGKRFPSHARLARHLYVCHRALIDGVETKGQVAMGTRTIPMSQTTSQPISPIKMAQNGNHLCRLCGRTFTFSSNLRRHIRKMHLQSPSKANAASLPTINIQPVETEKSTGEKVICDLCGQTYMTPGDLDVHLKESHQVIRKKLLFSNRGGQDGEKYSPLNVQGHNRQGGETLKPFGEQKSQDKVLNIQAGPPSSCVTQTSTTMSIQNIQGPPVPRTARLNVEQPMQRPELDLSTRSVKSEEPAHKMATRPMDLSVVKKEDIPDKKESPNSQPVDLTMGAKNNQSSENVAVDLTLGNAQHAKQESERNESDDNNSDKLEASRSLLRAALQAKQDAKSQHPKLMQLLGDSIGNKAVENVVSQADVRPPFSPLLMAAQMNLAFPPSSLAGAIPQFHGALFGAPFSYPVKRKMSDGVVGQLSPMSPGLDQHVKPPKPAKRRKSVNHQGYDSDGSKSPSQHSDGSVPPIDANFPSHFEGKRYICGLCSASFTFQTNLTRHQRKLHGKPYVRKPVLSSLTSVPVTTTTPSSSPQTAMSYDVPPTPPIFGPVVGVKTE